MEIRGIVGDAHRFCISIGCLLYVLVQAQFSNYYLLFRLIVITTKSAIIARKPSNPPVFSDGIIVLVSVGTAVGVRVGFAASVSVLIEIIFLIPSGSALTFISQLSLSPELSDSVVPAIIYPPSCLLYTSPSPRD